MPNWAIYLIAPLLAHLIVGRRAQDYISDSIGTGSLVLVSVTGIQVAYNRFFEKEDR